MKLNWKWKLCNHFDYMWYDLSTAYSNNSISKEYKQLFYSEFHEATQSWQILSHNILLFICKHTKKFEKWIYDAMIFLGIRNRSFFFICSKPKICRTVFFAVVTSVVHWDGFDINQSFLIFSSPIFFSSVVSHSYYHFLMPKKVYVVSLSK